MEATAKSLHLTVVSPDRTLFDGEAQYVQLPIHDGLIGVLAHHAPMVSVLGYGVLTLRSEREERQIILDGGFLEIRDNRVSVLANSATVPENLDFDQAQSDFDAAQALKPQSDEGIEDRWNRIAAARSRLRFRK